MKADSPNTKAQVLAPSHESRTLQFDPNRRSAHCRLTP